MTLTAGTRLGPYELGAPIGAGGMGEVYRARDTRLERTVAVKVLPSHLAASAESRQRFEREAKTISQLSHPHICALYDVGREGETEYLVMEYLEGETLSDRLLKGPLPFELVLRFGAEIADALDKAHRSGIVHRDLKPGNVMLTKSGVKLLDFGLAKAVAPATPQQLTSFPTQQALTQEGTILGTFQYMAPEQLEGRDADARTDIFAFGTVLYEMATGQKAFSGRTQASLIAAIIERVPPPISTIFPLTPPAFDRIVKTCLEKDPEDRWQTAHDVRLELKWVAEGGSAAGLPAPVLARRKSREKLAWLLAAFFAVVAAALAATHSWRAAGQTRMVRASLLPAPKTSFAVAGLSAPMAVSPDGRFLAYATANPEGRPVLWLRPLDSTTERALPGTEEAFLPFWSPDSRFIGFFAGGRLKKIAIAGGPALTICPAADGRGGAWARDGAVLFALRNSPIYRVSETGGVPVAVSKFDPARSDTTHRWPSVLPDGRRFLYFASPTGVASDAALFLASIDGKENRLLIHPASSNAVYVSEHLLYARENTLMAQPFDPARGRFVGEAVPIAEDLLVDPILSHAVFSVSENGVLAYETGAARLARRLMWHDRTGKEVKPAFSEPLMGTGAVRLSPDGTHFASSLVEPDSANLDIWTIDLERGVRNRLTFDPAADLAPVWSPDGARVAFFSERKGRPLLVKSARGEGSEETLFQSEELKLTTDWSRDGRFLLFNRSMQNTKTDIWVLPLSGDRKPFPFLQSEFIERNGYFSPDGRWVAYISDESGRLELYVRPFPGANGKWQISTSGAIAPRWRSDGKELFYMTSDRRLMAVEVEPGSEFRASTPKAFFSLRPAQTGFEPTHNGQQILLVAAPEEPSRPMTLVLNWDADLKKK